MGRDRNSPHTHTNQTKMLRLLTVVLAVSAAWGQECGECLPSSYQGITIAPGLSFDITFGQSYFDMDLEVSLGVLDTPASCGAAVDLPLDEALQSPEVSFVFNFFTSPA